MKKIDARGFACPRPVIMAKNAIADEKLESLIIQVDNEIATQNLSKMATQLGFSSDIKKDGEDYEVTLTKIGCEIIEETVAENIKEYAVAITSEEMGGGESDFSKLLLENFIYALKEQDELPKIILLYNTGVKLATVNETTISDLKELEEKGIEILSCGLCLENYGLKDKLQVGSITNMYKIVEILRKYKVVYPC